MVGEVLARRFAADQVEALEGIFLEAPQFEEALTRGHELDVVERREVYAADLVWGLGFRVQGLGLKVEG
jgi:hypothetical protein